MIKQTSRNTFNAFALFIRNPALETLATELEYYINTEEDRLGVILRDKTDQNFSIIALARNCYECFQIQSCICDITSLKDARSKLIATLNTIPKYISGKRFDGMNLFAIRTKHENLHPYFLYLNSTPQLYAAKKIMSELAMYIPDKDGNFVKDFQSISGFDSRVWELYLHCFLREEGFLLNNMHSIPDFITANKTQHLAIEAVVVGRNSLNPPTSKDMPPVFSPAQFQQELTNDMPLRFASVLNRKLKKEYWKLSHISNFPFLIAVADFHEAASMTWSFPSLIDYLYGKHSIIRYDSNKNPISTSIPIQPYHKESGACVPSGFFEQPGTENISGILFSATATLSKFNRMGIQAGFALDNNIHRRIVCFHNDAPNATKPRFKIQTIGLNSNETWAEGMNLFHNPHAKHPVNKLLFPSIAHHELIKDVLYSQLPAFHPYSSWTISISTL